MAKLPPPIKPGKTEEPAPVVAEAPKQKPKQSSPIRFASDRRYVTHLVKLLVAKGKRNESFKENEIKAVDVEHCHFWHTKARRGKDADTSVMTCGHLHKVKMGYDAEGALIDFECGPAVVEDIRQSETGAAIVGYKKKYLGKNGSGETVFDDHIHDMEYIKTSRVSFESGREIFIEDDIKFDKEKGWVFV